MNLSIERAERIAEFASTSLQRHGFAVASCVETSALIGRILGEMGLTHRRCVCRVLAMTPASARLIAEQGMPDPETYRALCDNDRTSGEPHWMIGIGYPDGARATGSIHRTSNRFIGHVVNIVETFSGPLLIDASIMQANRPQRGLCLEAPVVAQLDHSVNLRGTGCSLALRDPQGAAMKYELLPHLTAPAAPRHTALIEQLAHEFLAQQRTQQRAAAARTPQRKPAAALA